MLDIYCGSRPYEDLIPPGSRYTGLDIDDRYGTADVVTQEFLPFPDESFDLVLCTEGFHYVPDPIHGLAEIERVLRPGGRVVLTVPLVWQYDRTILEHRYTGPELAALLAGWDDVEVIENGGHAVQLGDAHRAHAGHAPARAGAVRRARCCGRCSRSAT